MELIFMGTGTSQGVPLIAYDETYKDSHCDLENKKNWRTRTSAHVVMDGTHIQIDTSPEFRLQCLWNNIRQIDHVIITHGHSDHVMGMDDLRRFCQLNGNMAMEVYASEEGGQRIKEVFPYAVRDVPAFKGYPAFKIKEFQQDKPLELSAGTISCTKLPHGNIDVLGFVFKEKSSGRRLAYYTDCNDIPAHAFDLAAGCDVLVIDALRPEPHPTHLTLEQAANFAEQLGAKKTFFTHMTHFVDHDPVDADLPDHVSLAYDGLKITV